MILATDFQDDLWENLQELCLDVLTVMVVLMYLHAEESGPGRWNLQNFYKPLKRYFDIISWEVLYQIFTNRVFIECSSAKLSSAPLIQQIRLLEDYLIEKQRMSCCYTTAVFSELYLPKCRIFVKERITHGRLRISNWHIYSKIKATLNNKKQQQLMENF